MPTKNEHTEEGEQLNFDFNKQVEPYFHWPPQEEFPLNLKEWDRNVEKILKGDIYSAKSFLILTGYTSLSYLIDTFGNDEKITTKSVRIVLGFDPNFRGRKRYHEKPLDKEIKEYWLKKGLSILQGGSVINLISKIEKGEVQFKFFQKLHAKIYVSHKMAMIGSSNFSNNGLKDQTEANYRILQDENEEAYDHIHLIAENYFKKADNYESIISLLENLIKQVDWRDALARAIAEVLEGGWLDDFGVLSDKIQNTKLWPTQKRGLAQAISILQENSNVLIADPTGAGKTKMCSTIILGLKNWLWENGRKEQDNSVIVCPPLVIDKWKKEFRDLATVSNNQISNGTLSNGGARSLGIAEADLELANILAIDEAHNYLNLKAKRSIAIRKNNADFKILITATPINKKVDDLLKVVELLDVDNLDDESFEAFKNLKSRPDLKQEREIEILKGFISRFTVRRTKKELNNQIAREPDLYENALGKTCKFPKQKSKTYQTKETLEDREIVLKINELCDEIKGITYLKQINKLKFPLPEEEKQNYINRRFSAAKHLSIYTIRYRLRSSKMALIEHILGEEKALELEDFRYTRKTKNKVKIQQLDEIIVKNKRPPIRKDFKHCQFPEWYADRAKYIEACKEEKLIYSKIADLAKKLSNERELGKTSLLIDQLKTHEKIIAFDSCLITLSYLKHLIKKKSDKNLVLLATGENKKESEEVLKKFHLTSDDTDKIVALCSDKMSEGVDLQKASAITLLDLPSVIRIVEQRFGRIDRMDTPYEEIEMYWPDDSKEYALRGDKKLMELNDLVDSTIGSNFEIPDRLKFKHFSKTSSITDTVKEFEDYSDSDASWDGIRDSFQSIIELKEGKDALITPEQYNIYRNVDTSVKTGVSFVESDEKWCFIALRGDKEHSPKWYFIEPNTKDSIHTEFPEICDRLKKYLRPKKQLRIKWNDKYLNQFIEILRTNEINLLSPKKRRAIEVAKSILEKRLKTRSTSPPERKIIKDLLVFFGGKRHLIDLDDFAKKWIIFLQPYLDTKRERSTRSREVFNLNALNTNTEINRMNFDINVLTEIYDNILRHESIDHKVASCIIGVRKEDAEIIDKKSH